MACASVFIKDWTSWSVQRDARTYQRLKSDGSRNNDFSNMSWVQEMSCRRVALPHARKTQARQRNMYYKKYTSCFQTSLKHLHQTIQDIQKGILCLISVTLRDSQKRITQAYWNHLESKNILKNVMLQDFMTNRCTSNNSQKRFFFQWDGQSLAPRAYGGGRGRGWGSKHPSSNQVFSQQTSNKIRSAIVLHPQK